MDPSLSLRPIVSQDHEFLMRVYSSTRTEELAPLAWSQTEKDAFLKMQFEAQHRFYQEQFSLAQFQVILLGDQPIGRLYVDRREDEIRLIDIALLPEHRNRGIGSRMLRDLLGEARAVDKPVRIHVEQYNPAMGLYLRLGFRHVDDNGVYALMEWSPWGDSLPVK